MTLFTIGFTQKTAEQFFEKLKTAGVRRMVDIRLNNTSQLAGFAKRDDLVYFLKSICSIDYVHIPKLAPDQKLFELIKKKKGPWAQYESGFLKLLAERKIDRKFLNKTLQDGDCLLCSEHSPERCHRRIVAEQFKSTGASVEIIHL